MYFRTFFFLLFLATVAVFFLSSFNPALTLNVCGSICRESLGLNYIQLTSMFASAISLLLFVISNYYAQKNLLKEREKLATDRLNIEQIHAELEALRV